MRDEAIEIEIALSNDIDMSMLFAPFRIDKISGVQISINKVKEYAILHFKISNLRNIEKILDILDSILEIASRYYRRKEKNLKDL